MPLIEKQITRKLQLKNYVDIVRYGWRIQLLIWINSNVQCKSRLPQKMVIWQFLIFSVAHVNAFLTTKNYHVISQLMSTGRQMRGQIQMCVAIGQKIHLPQLWQTMMNTYYFVTIWTGRIRITLWQWIVWCRLKNATNLWQLVNAGFGKF